MVIENKNKVTLDYEGRFENGEIFDTVKCQSATVYPTCGSFTTVIMTFFSFYFNNFILT